MADLLGYPTHAAYILELRMAKDQDTVANFLKDLAQKLRVLQKDELKTFLEFKKEEVSNKPNIPDHSVFNIVLP